jgi:hypothetical protein
MSGVRRMEEQKKGRQIPVGGTSNEKSSNMMTGGKNASKKHR